MLKKHLIIGLILFSGSVYAVEFLNMSLVYNYSASANPCTVEGGRIIGLTNDTGTLRLFVISPTDNTLTSLNVTNITSFSCLVQVTDTVPSNSFERALRGRYNSSNKVGYILSQTDDNLHMVNLSSDTAITALGSVTDSVAPGSLDAGYEVAVKSIGGTVFAAATGTADDDLSLYNVTATASAPVSVSTRNTPTGPCSTDDLRAVLFEEFNGNHIIITGSWTDDTVGVINVSETGTMTCLDDYTDSASPNSVDGVRHLFFENSTGLLYVAGNVDDEFTILNLTNLTNIVAVGSVSGQPGPGAIFVTTIGNDKWAFVGGLTNANRFTINNVTNPSSPTLYQNVSNYSGSCNFNETLSFVQHNNYLITSGGSGAASCINVFKLYDPEVVGGDSCTYPGSGNHTYALEDNCIITSTVDATGNTITVSGAAGSFTIASGGELICNDLFYTPSDFNGDSEFRLLSGGKKTIKP